MPLEEWSKYGDLAKNLKESDLAKKRVYNVGDSDERVQITIVAYIHELDKKGEYQLLKLQ